MSGMTRFLRDFPVALHEGSAALFVGAGVSMAAGYPSWSALLRDIAQEMGVNAGDIQDLAALAQWHIRESGGATGVRNVIRKEIGVDRPVPEALEIIARLPVRHIWTTNYDRLVERAFASISRPIDVVSGAKDLALKATPGAARYYKMHGSIERLDDIVISTDDYELYRSRRGAFLPLLQAHLTSMSLLFIGLSLTDPNIRHVLSLIRESFTEDPPEHFAIVRPPQRADAETDDAFAARSAQHRLWARDLSRYGLVTVEVDDYDEVPALLRQVERRVAGRRIWVSGSWPLEAPGPEAARLYRLSEQTGQWIGQNGYDLVSGSGVLVGPATIAGFIDALRNGGGWDVNRRLIVRPFPQPVPGKPADPAQWTALRTEFARQSGVVIFLGGARMEEGAEIAAPGVLEEFRLARAAGAFLLPVGSTGGAAKAISDQLVGSALASSGPDAIRPTDEELGTLAHPDADAEAILKIVAGVLGRLNRPG